MDLRIPDRKSGGGPRLQGSWPEPPSPELHSEIYRGSEYTVDFIPKIKLEIVLEDDRVQDAIDAIVKSAKTDKIGDGKVFVSSVEGITRIRTGETGIDAV
mgnify:CR=1 FL=1